MRIRFVSEREAAQANATLSDGLIEELTLQARHPIARHKGLGSAIFPTIPGGPEADKVVVNKKLMGPFSPAEAIVTDEALVAKVQAELGGQEAPKASKSSKKK